MKTVYRRLTSILCILTMLAAFMAGAVPAFADADDAQPLPAADVEAAAPQEEPDGSEDPADEEAAQSEDPAVIEETETPAEETEAQPAAEPEALEESEELDTDGEPSYSWKQVGSDWYLYNDAGEQQIGLIFVGDDLYYLNPNDGGKASGGWRLVNNNWYFFDTASKAAAKGAAYVRGSYYYFDEETRIMAVGLVTAPDGSKYYANSSGRLQSGWVKVSGQWYYFGATEYKALTGLWSISKNKYYFNEDGVMQTGLLTITDERTGVTDGIYYFKSSGAAMSGWYQKADGGWYYFGSTTKQALRGFWTIGGYGRYFDDDCVLVSGNGLYTTEAGKTYYLSGDKAKTGWIKNADGTWSYFSPSYGTRAENSLWSISNKRYYFDENGIMSTEGWKTVDGRTYYFQPNGSAKTGWYKENGEWFYFLSYSGEMVTGWQKINGTCRYFYTESDAGVTGAMAYGTTIDDREIDENGIAKLTAQELMISSAQSFSSNTEYLLLVDTYSCNVGVFTGSQGNWELQYYWLCTCGKTGHLTPTGGFTTGDKYYSFGSDYYTCYYGTSFLYQGGYEWLFHSLLYYPGTMTVKGVQLGQYASNGCVRLALENAKWIYDNIPAGTKVVSY